MPARGIGSGSRSRVTVAERGTVCRVAEESSSSRFAGDAVAEAWEANADFIARVAAPTQRWLIDSLDPQPGQTILELGAGPGDTGFEAARRIGPDGRLISTDVSSGMVEVAKRRASSLGVSGVEFRVMDAESIDLADDSVDGVLHRFGPMLLPEPAKSFSGVRRVLRKGGRFAAATFTGPDENPWITTMAMSVMQSGVEMPADANPFGPGGPFSLSDPDVLRGMLNEAGFDAVDTEVVDQVWEFASLDEAWDRMSTLGGPMAVLIAQLDEEKRRAVKESYQSAVAQFSSAGSYGVPGRALCVVAS